MSTKLLFVVVIIIALMVLYNYYIIHQVMLRQDKLFRANIKTQELISGNFEQDLEYITKLVANAEELDDTLDLLRKERELINLRHADIIKRVDKLEHHINKLYIINQKKE